MAYVVSYKDYKKIFAGELHESQTGPSQATRDWYKKFKLEYTKEKLKKLTDQMYAFNNGSPFGPDWTEKDRVYDQMLHDTNEARSGLAKICRYEMKKYEHMFKYVGYGFDKMAFISKDNACLKLSYNNAGQIEEEIRVYNQFAKDYSCFAEIYDYDENGFVSELCEVCGQINKDAEKHICESGMFDGWNLSEVLVLSEALLPKPHGPKVDYGKLKALLGDRHESNEWWDQIWKFLDPFIGKVVDAFQSEEATDIWGNDHAYDCEYVIQQLRNLFLYKPETEAYKAIQSYIALRTAKPDVMCDTAMQLNHYLGNINYNWGEHPGTDNWGITIRNGQECCVVIDAGA